MRDEERSNYWGAGRVSHPIGTERLGLKLGAFCPLPVPLSSTIAEEDKLAR